MTDARPASEASAERVRAFLAEHRLADGIVRFGRSTHTAALAAEAIGCELGQIAKSLVFVVDDRPVVALVAGDRKGDGKAISRAVEGGKARFADAETVLAATGYPAGAVSPFDLPHHLTVLVDESLSRYETVYPAAGTDESVVAVPLETLVPMIGGRFAPVGKEQSA